MGIHLLLIPQDQMDTDRPSQQDHTDQDNEQDNEQPYNNDIASHPGSRIYYLPAVPFIPPSSTHAIISTHLTGLIRIVGFYACLLFFLSFVHWVLQLLYSLRSLRLLFHVARIEFRSFVTGSSGVSSSEYYGGCGRSTQGEKSVKRAS